MNNIIITLATHVDTIFHAVIAMALVAIASAIRKGGKK